MRVIRIDPHAHLYDTYSVKEWCEAVLRNARVDQGALPVVIIVDREGQRSLDRLRQEVPTFGAWRELGNGGAGEISCGGSTFIVVQGVQYVTQERCEVLGLGVARGAPDGLAASNYLSLICQHGGIVCLPWSPGKWLGSRGRVVREILSREQPGLITVGDIAIRSWFGPPSTLLWFARKRGFSILRGTDPLPRRGDATLVCSFGLEIAMADLAVDALPTWEPIRRALLTGAGVSGWGRRNSPLQAVIRFLGL